MLWFLITDSTTLRREVRNDSWAQERHSDRLLMAIPNTMATHFMPTLCY